MLNMVLDFSSREPVGSWLSKHAGRMREVGSRIAALSPAAVRIVLNNGGTVNFAHDHANWRMDAVAIARIAQLDENVAK